MIKLLIMRDHLFLRSQLAFGRFAQLNLLLNANYRQTGCAWFLHHVVADINLCSRWTQCRHVDFFVGHCVTSIAKMLSKVKLHWISKSLFFNFGAFYKIDFTAISSNFWFALKILIKLINKLMAIDKFKVHNSSLALSVVSSILSSSSLAAAAVKVDEVRISVAPCNKN